MSTSIIRSLRSSDPAIRSDALSRAARMTHVDPAERAAIEGAVAAALRDDVADVRVAAIRAVVRLRVPQALQALIRVAGEDPAPEVRREAVAALARLISPVPPGLTGRLRS